MQVGRIISLKKAQAWSLVLSSMEIPHELCRQAKGRASIRVDAKHLAAAESQISQWRKETIQNYSKAVFTIDGGVSLAGLYSVLVLLLIHLIAVSGVMINLVQAGVLDVDKVKNGEVWRLVTAILLHSDWGHLASNLILGWIIITALAVLASPGRAIFLALSGGIIANIVNVLVHHQSWLSLGFSNAVFASLGAVISIQLYRNGIKGSRYHGNMVFGAGISLLAFFGLGEGSDLTGHVSGYLSGMGLAILLGMHQPRARRIFDSICLALSLGLVTAACSLALYAA